MKDGNFDWARLVKPAKPNAADQGSAPTTSEIAETTPWQIRLDAVHFEKPGILLNDVSRTQPLAFAVGSLDARTQLTTTIGTATATLADKLEVQVTDIALKQSGQQESLAALASLNLSDARVDTQSRQVTAQQLKLLARISHRGSSRGRRGAWRCRAHAVEDGAGVADTTSSRL